VTSTSSDLWGASRSFTTRFEDLTILDGRVTSGVDGGSARGRQIRANHTPILSSAEKRS
jgi:hypothetical protein